MAKQRAGDRTTNGSTPARSGPTREWVTFADPREEGRTWQVDVTFLTSRWTCIFGRGCQGVHEQPTPELVHGCCSYGAHFSDKKDRQRVERLARKLRPEEWQHREKGRRKGIYATLGPKAWRTRLHDGACIFLNRPGFAAGPGCALHLHTLNEGVHFSATKPEVCWQLPLRREDEAKDDGTVVSWLTEFGRSGWGEGGDDFAWWCTEAPEAFTGDDVVYRSMEAELRLMLGDELYDQVRAYLDQRVALGAPPPVRHPAEVPVALVAKPAAAPVPAPPVQEPLGERLAGPRR